MRIFSITLNCFIEEKQFGHTNKSFDQKITKKTYRFSISYTLLDGLAPSLPSYRKKQLSRGSRGKGYAGNFRGDAKKGRHNERIDQPPIKGGNAEFRFGKRKKKASAVLFEFAY
jgi:hypothetical protein